MICYIKSFKDFKTIEKYEIIDYSFSDGEDGSVKAIGNASVDLSMLYKGCWMIVPFNEKSVTDIPYELETEVLDNGGTAVKIKGNNLKIRARNISENGGIEYSIDSEEEKYSHSIYYISECTPSEGTISFTIQHPIYAFSRRILYAGEVTYGALIRNAIERNYGRKCPDLEYALTYITVTGGSDTACIIETDDYGYYTPCDVFEYARKIGIDIIFSIVGNNILHIEIREVKREYGIVLFDSGHAQLEDETYGSDYFSKVTIIQGLQDQGSTIGASDSKDLDYHEADMSIQVCQDIAGSKSRKKSALMVRIRYSWEDAPEEIKFDNCVIQVFLNDASGTSLLDDTFSWEIKEEAGVSYSDWKALSDLSVISECTLYVLVIPNRYPNEQEADNYDTLMFTVNVSDIIAPSDILFGPMDENANRAKYRVLDYYLTEDGHVTDDRSLAVFDGKWTVIDASNDASPYETALEEFDQNDDNHKVEFYSDIYYDYYQPIRMRLRNEVLDTLVTARTLSSSDSRYYYKCGRLLTRLTDKIKVLSSQIKN